MALLLLNYAPSIAPHNHIQARKYNKKGNNTPNNIKITKWDYKAIVLVARIHVSARIAQKKNGAKTIKL